MLCRYAIDSASILTNEMCSAKFELGVSSDSSENACRDINVAYIVFLFVLVFLICMCSFITIFYIWDAYSKNYKEIKFSI